jgi:hypothetical protein
MSSCFQWLSGVVDEVEAGGVDEKGILLLQLLLPGKLLLLLLLVQPSACCSTYAPKNMQAASQCT